MSRLEEAENAIKWAMSNALAGNSTKPDMIKLSRTLAAEVDELQRRLDAVVNLCKECDPAMNSYYLISCPCGWKGSSSECDGGEWIVDSDEWCDIECPVCKRQDPPTLHTRAVAIAEGRDNG